MRKLPSLRTMTQAGGKLLPELHKKFAEYAQRERKRFIVMYGQSEATARMAWLPADKALEKCGAMGIAIPGGKFRLLDEKGQDITTPNIVGELLYEGRNVTMGYAECCEDLTKGDERGGILLTGDMAKFDKDGFFYIVGRKNAFLKFSAIVSVLMRPNVCSRVISTLNVPVQARTMLCRSLLPRRRLLLK